MELPQPTRAFKLSHPRVHLTAIPATCDLEFSFDVQPLT